MRAHAPIQFSKRCLAGRSRVERFRDERNFRCDEKCQLAKRRIDIRKIDNRPREIFGRRVGNRAKNFAAMNRLRLLRWLGMKRATCLRRFGVCRERANHAVIGNREPRTDRDRSDQATRSRSHTGFNRRVNADAQMFSSVMMVGAAPVAVTSGGRSGVVLAAGADEILGASLIRVDINIAVKRSAAAR